VGPAPQEERSSTEENERKEVEEKKNRSAYIENPI